VATSLNIHRTLLWMALRMVVQLLLVGLVLRTVFALSSPWITLLVLLLMVVAAARELAADSNGACGARGSG
jgi:putative ABC transport system permease protein